jgi:hypothetical protein
MQDKAPIGLKGLPTHLIVLFGVYLVVPFWSLTFMPAPWTAFSEGHFWHALALFAAYWVLPAAISAMIFRRSYLFLPLFLADCFMLMLASLTAPEMSPVGILALKATVLGFVGVTAVFFHKDTLYVVLGNQPRSWRKSPRYTANAVARLRHPALGTDELRTRIADYSMTGVGAYLHPEDMARFDTCFDGTPEFRLVLSHTGGTDLEVPVRATTRPDINRPSRVGFEAKNAEAMRVLTTALATANRKTAVTRWVGAQMMRANVQRGALAAWCGAIVIVFALEAYSKALLG